MQGDSIDVRMHWIKILQIYGWLITIVYKRVSTTGKSLHKVQPSMCKRLFSNENWCNQLRIFSLCEAGSLSELQLNSNLMTQDDTHNQIHRLRHSAFIYSFLFLYIILFHLSSTSMPPPKSRSKEPGSPTKKRAAKWNTAETEALITFFRGEYTRVGGISFKDASFISAANHIQHLHTDGPIKTAAHCRTKWTAVRFFSYRWQADNGSSNPFSPSWRRNSTQQNVSLQAQVPVLVSIRKLAVVRPPCQSRVLSTILRPVTR